MLCKSKEMGTESLRTFFTFTLNFRIFKECITLRNDTLDGSLSRNFRDFTANSLNCKRDLKYRLLFTLLTIMSLMT